MNEKVYDETNVPAPEYRVRTVPRYIVTRYCFPYQSADGRVACSGRSDTVGEFPNEQRAFDVAQALAKSEGGTVSV